MKRYLLFCQLALLYSVTAVAQFSAGNDGFYTKVATDVYVDGLTFRPTSAFLITDRTLTISSTALAGSPPSISRVYTFDAPIVFNGRLGLFYQANELNGNTESQLQVVHQNTTTVTTTGSVVSSINHYIYNDLTAPITFRAATAAQPGALPVTLTNFTAKKEGPIAYLKWSTSYESNSDYFAVEHSMDAKNWIQLSRVSAASNSHTSENYSYSHSSPSTGTNFYRLKMVDKDHSFAYSTIRELQFDLPSGISIYPNPVLEKLSLRIDKWEEIVGIKLLNSQGISVFQSERNVSKEINMNGFSPGLYIVQLKKVDGSTNSVKIIKQ